METIIDGVTDHDMSKVSILQEIIEDRRKTKKSSARRRWQGGWDYLSINNVACREVRTDSAQIRDMYVMPSELPHPHSQRQSRRWIAL